MSNANAFISLFFSKFRARSRAGWYGPAMASILVGLNYHRIGGRDPANPLHRLHTVERGVFEAQIAHARARGPFVTLDEVAAGRLPDGVSFLLTFDDVSRTVESVRRWLLDRRIPFHLCPASGIAGDGFGVRDKVNWIIGRLAPEDVAAALEAAFGPQRESFYRFTKARDRIPEEIETRLIDPLFARAGTAAALRACGAYLSWRALRAEYAGRPGIGLVNHGAAHRRMDLMDAAAIAAEIDAAEAAFAAELGAVPKDFAVPFGEFDGALAGRLRRVLGPRGYRTVLWVDRHANPMPRTRGAGRPLDIGRLHAPASLARFRETLDRAIARARPLPSEN